MCHVAAAIFLSNRSVFGLKACLSKNKNESFNPAQFFTLSKRLSWPTVTEAMNLQCQILFFFFLKFVIVLKFKNVTFSRWTGSDNNNKGNAGQGQKRTDRSNVIEIANKTFKSCYNNDSDSSYIGCPARNYPKKLSESTFLGFDKDTLTQLAFSGSK